MKTSIYFSYTSRSLLRGGQRTVLAVFCVAVGVMAIVALQLVGLMINNALTSNVRDANGGDVAVSSNTKPFTSDDLSFFNQLQASGTIISYTGLANSSGSTSNSASITSGFSVKAVDPGSFPIVTPPTFTDPANGSISSLLTGNGVIVDKTVADQHNLKVGDELDIHAGQQNQSPRILHVKIAGIVTDSGALAQSSGGVMLVSLNDYNAALPNAPIYYDTVYVTATDQAHIDQAVKAINAQFPLATTQAAADALKSQQGLVDNIKKFLEIAGLLALLIGGVGIVNTMQVLLSRRKIEIAMLKTTGYRRFDLYLLFGLEAGLLGLVGGVVGAAAAIGVSYLVRNIVQQVFPIIIPFFLDPVIIGGGVLIGLVTALIFGLLPIVQVAKIRPLNVIRELPGGNRVGSIFLTIGLLLLLSVLFCALAIVILNDVVLGISAVYGAFIFLAVLSLLFGLVVLVISVLPVPERFSFGYLALVIGGLAVSALLYLTILPTFGALLFVVSLMGIVIVLLPRSWKSNTKIALRNLGRQRSRTTTTLLALFVGVFTIGLILVLGQDLRDNINAAIAKNLTFNLVTIARGADATKLQANLGTVPGLSIDHTAARTYAADVPVAIDGTPFTSLLPKNDQGGPNDLGKGGTRFYLGGLEGYDVAHNQLPDTQNVTFTGRNLNASDAGTNNVLVNDNLVKLAPLKGHLHVGSTITLASIDGKTIKTVTVVGTYQTSALSLHFGPILTTREAVASLTTAGQATTIFYMKIDPAKVGKALQAIGNIAPNASVFNL